MAWVNTPRLGVPYPSGTSTDLASFAQKLQDAFLGIDTQTVKFGFGPTTTRPAASIVNNGLVWWNGTTMTWCDGFHDIEGTPTPTWLTVGADSYIDVRDYGVRPYPSTSRNPAPPSVLQPNYDPYSYYRPYDAGPGINAALQAAMDTSDAGFAPGRNRRSKPVFVPPGSYCLFTPIVVQNTSTYGATNARLFGSFPHTILRVFPDVVGTGPTGTPLTYTGFPGNAKVINVSAANGEFSESHIEGFVVQGHTANTPVQEVLGFETNSPKTLRNCRVEASMAPYGSAVDVSAGSVTINYTATSVVENVEVVGPAVAYSARTGNPDVSPNGSFPYGRGAGVGFNLSEGQIIARNLSVSNYPIGVFVDVGYGAQVLDITGLNCNNNQYTDLLINTGRTFIRGYVSRSSARMAISVAGAGHLDISGTFFAGSLGWPGEPAPAINDVARFADAGGHWVFRNIRVDNWGSGATRTIGTNSLTHTIFVDLENSSWPSPIGSLIRSIDGGAQTRLTARNYIEINPATGTVIAKTDLFTPGTTVWKPIVTTTVPANAVAFSNASDLATTQNLLGEVIRIMSRNGQWQ